MDAGRNSLPQILHLTADVLRLQKLASVARFYENKHVMSSSHINIVSVASFVCLEGLLCGVGCSTGSGSTTGSATYILLNIRK
jgi:hypothetical protein